LRRRFEWLALLLVLGAGPDDVRRRQNHELLDRVAAGHHLTADQKSRMTAIFDASRNIGQGNPAVTVHAMSVDECKKREADAGLDWKNPEFEKICGGPYMAPLYDPAKQRPSDATACIDQMEFPDLPCEYPVVWTRAMEAEDICLSMGKRLCDAHEWEGGCAGALEPPDYRWDLAKGQTDITAVRRMRDAHNAQYPPGKRTWSYGDHYQKGVCAAASRKSETCAGGDWTCGSNTYPTGSFPACHSPLGVYDINGNAAEHMNLPLAEDEMASRGTKLGVVEMKGSWFIFDSYRAHDDWCRWRAPFWHGTRVMDDESHRNYHLGFRCCKDTVAPAP
jgi:formylglycine-generating enzyme required for sulfatase activity